MVVFGPLLISTIAGLSTVLGTLVIFLKISSKSINKFISFCLSFSFTIMILISITDLIPNSSYVILNNYGLYKGIAISITIFSLGIALINLINRKMNKELEKNSSLYKIGILSMLALMIHNFPEGIATFMASWQNIGLGVSLSIAIMLHNIPEGISIAVPIYYARGNKKEAIVKTLISGLTEPLGAIIAWLFLAKYINDVLISIILILVAGIMIALSINELLPQTLKYKEEKFMMLGLLSGIIIFIIQHFVF